MQLLLLLLVQGCQAGQECRGKGARVVVGGVGVGVKGP